MLEFKVLNNVLDYMESTGSTYKIVTLSIDEELVEQINSKYGSKNTLEELQRATDKCLAHEWIEYASSDGKYSSLSITPKGIGAARSKQKAEELKSSRSLLKKTSDYIEDNRGLFIVLGFLLAIATLALRAFGN